MVSTIFCACNTHIHIVIIISFQFAITYITFTCLEDVAEIFSPLTVDKGKYFAILWVEGAKGYGSDFDCGKVLLHRNSITL